MAEKIHYFLLQIVPICYWMALLVGLVDSALVNG
jgi:hypothetical protein